MFDDNNVHQIRDDDFDEISFSFVDAFVDNLFVFLTPYADLAKENHNASNVFVSTVFEYVFHHSEYYRIIDFDYE